MRKTVVDKQVYNKQKGNMKLIICIPIALLVCVSGNAEQCKPSALPPDPSSGCCGRATRDRIIPGFFAQLDEYPWMGLVEYLKNNETQIYCSAVLISNRYALSAAQCFSADVGQVGMPVKIRLGEYDTSNQGPDCVEINGGKDCNTGAISIPIEKTIVHPDFKKDRDHHNDIALIRLAETVPNTDFISPICLPTSDITVNPPSGLRMKVAGWGAINATTSSTDVLHHIDVPYFDFENCKTAYVAFRANLGNGQLCAGGEGKDACKGDSGGPLMNTKLNYTELAGLVSFGSSICGQAKFAGVYTKVFAYDKWIRENIKE